MFKKQFEELKNFIKAKLEDYVFVELKDIHKEIRDLKYGNHKYEQLEKTIKSQQMTIEQLTKALCGKYEHGLFIFSEDCKIPMVIRNGKELTSDLTTSFSIDWNPGEFPNIQIEQAVGTCSDNDY